VYGQGIDEMFHRAPAIDRIEAAVGWRPTRTLEEIVADVVAYAREADRSLQPADL
jgi:UDP-glucose 4-epimerase